MKVIRAVGTVMLSLSLTAAIPAFAQDKDKDKQDEKSAPQEARPDRDKDRVRPNDNGPRHEEGKRDQDQPAARPDRDQDERRGQPAAARPQQEQREQRREQQNDQRNDRRMDQQRQAQGQRGRHIPDDRFRASFGAQHRFHVRREQIVNNPQPVVVYGGYSFQLVEPWPSVWSYDDYCYIDYVDDGYYLFDAFHPGFRVAVFILE